MSHIGHSIRLALHLRSDPVQIGLHVLLPFGEPPGDDPAFFCPVVQRFPRSTRTAPGPSAPAGAHSPSLAGSTSYAHVAPRHRVRERSKPSAAGPRPRRPHTPSATHRAPHVDSARETCADLQLLGAVQPLDVLQLGRTPCRQVDVGDKPPGGRNIAPDSLCHFYRGLIAIAHPAIAARQRPTR